MCMGIYSVFDVCFYRIYVAQNMRFKEGLIMAYLKMRQQEERENKVRTHTLTWNKAIAFMWWKAVHLSVCVCLFACALNANGNGSFSLSIYVSPLFTLQNRKIQSH